MSDDSESAETFREIMEWEITHAAREYWRAREVKEGGMQWKFLETLLKQVLLEGQEDE